MGLLELVGLADRPDEQGRNFSYGDQRRLEIARALALEPQLLLLDEPAAGMNPHETEELDKLITRIRDRGVTIILVEHDMRLVMDISDRVTVLNFGTKIAEGNPKEIQRNRAVIEAYLGEDVQL
jgi:branched-chain amino acid transport system ATP-binding protein